MATVDYTEWGDVAPQTKRSSSGGGSEGFVKLSQGITVVRPVHKPVEFYKWFHRNGGQLRTAIARKEQVIKDIMAEHPDLNKPTHRYAIYSFDRADGNKLKIMEAPVTVFRSFRIRYDATGITPGGTKGGDWEIEVTGSGPKNTRYECRYVKDSPFTEEEKEKIKEMLADKDRLLTARYTNNTVEEIEKRLFGEWEKNDNKSEDTETPRSSNDNGESSEATDGDLDW